MSKVQPKPISSTPETKVTTPLATQTASSDTKPVTADSKGTFSPTTLAQLQGAFKQPGVSIKDVGSLDDRKTFSPNARGFDKDGTSKGLEQMGFKPVAGNTISEKIYNAALQYKGSSTCAGPGGGNLACAWSVNNILKNAGVAPVGGDSVPGVEDVLKGGRGTLENDPKKAPPGCIVIWPDSGHVGICLGNGQVISNSSSKAAFVWVDAIPAGSRIYKVVS